MYQLAEKNDEAALDQSNLILNYYLEAASPPPVMYLKSY